MDRKGFAEKLNGLKNAGKRFRWAIVGTVTGVIFLAIGMRVARIVSSASSPKQAETRMAMASHGSKKVSHRSDSHSGGWLSRLVHKYASALVQVQDEVDTLRRSDEENQRLRAENAHLRLVLESQRYECYAQRAQKLTRDFEMKLSRETGAKTGRTLASIPYKVPMDLMPNQLYNLGVSYFTSREDEKAAVILTFLTGLEDEDAFKTPRNYMMTGIAWYRLQNFELANYYFDKALGTPETPETARLHGQVRLWKGLVAYRLGEHMKAQHWLREVLNHDPHSTEAAWVNSTERFRMHEQEDGEAELRSVTPDPEVKREPADAE